MCRNDLSGGDVERGKQGRGAVPLVIVALASQGTSVRQLQIALRPLQGLDRRLFVDTQNNRLGGRIDIEADHIGGFRRELGVVALTPRFASRKIDIVLTQEAPDILNVNVAQALGQQRTRPPRKPHGRRLVQKRQNALVRRPAVDRPLASPGKVLEPAKTVIGKAPPPMADNARLNPNFFGDRSRAAALGRQQHDPRPPHVTLRRARRPASRLKHLAYLRLQPNFSCFGNHPNLESRITCEIKWVLVWLGAKLATRRCSASGDSGERPKVLPALTAVREGM